MVGNQDTLAQNAPTPLDSISISGFRSINSLQKLQLRSINVLIGPNGSGKSNFIGAFSFLRSIREGKLQQYVRSSGGAEQLLHFGSKKSKQIHFHLTFRDEVNQYELTLQPTNDDSLFPAVENAYFWDKKQYPDRPFSEPLAPQCGGLEAGISNTQLKRTADWVRWRLEGLRLYHLHDTSDSSPMRKTALLNDNSYFRSDGSNLPSFLYLLNIKFNAEYQVIRKTISRIAPFFDDFVLAPDPLNEEAIRLMWRHKGSDQIYGVSSLSDGTLRFIALATLFLQPDKYLPSVIMVDEPELGLHPRAIALLASLVRAASNKKQVIISTQSPFLLDHFDPEDVLVAERQHGGTQLSRLDSERLKKWLDDYSLGQLWEKNELGGRPRPE